MNQEQIKAAREALDNMDDYARMNAGVDAIGPRGVLEAFIIEVERTSAPVSVMDGENASRPDLLERLTYHEFERDDMSIDDLLQTLSSDGYKNVRQRTHRQLELQLLALLAAAAPQAHAEPVANKVQNNPYTATFPNEIWLQVGDCGVNELTPYAETYRNTDMTWSSDSIDKYDVRYIRADLAASLPPDTVGGEAVRDVLAERKRQVTAEGWTPEHYDEHDVGEMAAAAMHSLVPDDVHTQHTPMDWSWAFEWWKPGSKRRNLVKAGALILAEIERIDRAAKPNADCSTGSVKP